MVHSFPWWNDTTFYEIFVRSFYDSDGDGIGDFKGIRAKLDYLNDGNTATTEDLGITGLWLMPIFPSPSYHGYDVTDYTAVNPDYGTMDDFIALVAEAHQRGIRVIIDLPLNHTSDQHAWFQAAVSDPNSPERDWYIWSPSDPAYPGPWGQDVWHDSPTGYYYGLFVDFMPDLNFDNQSVTQKMEQVTAFWLREVGIDGFRLDAAKHLVEEGAQQENTPSTHEWYESYRPVYKGLNSEALMIGEVFGADPAVMASYTEGDELDLTFDFGLASAILRTASTGNAFAFRSQAKLTNKIVPDLQYATFITNHDQARVLSQLRGDLGRARVAAALLLTAPGVPFIYYGEEIGMTGTKPDEDIRRPMQWSADANAGFTTGSPWRAPAENYLTTNVAAQDPDPTSLLNYYRSLTQLRRDHSALRTGDTYLLETGNAGVYAILRVDPAEALIVVINLKDAAITDFGLSLASPALADGDYTPQTVFGGRAEPAPLQIVNGAFDNYRPLEQLEAGTAYVFKLK